MGLVKLFLVWGLWMLKRWAFWATMFIAAVSLLSSVLAVTEPGPTDWALLSDLLRRRLQGTRGIPYLMQMAMEE